MGANSRRRRAARNRGAAPPGGRDPLGAEDPFDDYDAPGAHFVVEAAVLGVARRIGARSLTSAELAECFLGLRRRIGPCPPFLLTLVLSEVLDRLVHDLFDGGWSRDDLVELVRRRAGAEYLPALHAALDGEDAIDPDSRVAQALALRVVALLGCAPPVTVGDLLDFGAERDRRPEHPKLARVRALLAKAESTEYDEEAEALTAKAQELITKYSLDELVDHGAGGGTGLQLRRLWIDPPYVRAKASLVHEVADANRCRSAVTDSLGFCLLVGAPADLAAVELLVTSLLVQADTAMVRHGRRVDRGGRSRTRSFRRSFLLAFAGRVGERLRTAAQSVAAEGGSDLLPVLRDHERQVSEAFEAALPGLVTKAASAPSSWEGWAAGLAAGDLAQIDVLTRLEDRSA